MPQMDYGYGPEHESKVPGNTEGLAAANPDDAAEETHTPDEINEDFVNTLLDKLTVLDDQIALEKASLAGIMDDRKELVENTIPNYLEAKGVSKIETLDGVEVTVATKTRCSIVKDQKGRALAWLEDNEHEKLLKRVLLVNLGGDSGEVEDLLREVIQNAFEADEKFDVPDMATDLKVEPATLTSLADRLIKEGIEMPSDIFHVYEQREAKVKQLKRKS